MSVMMERSGSASGKPRPLPRVGQCFVCGRENPRGLNIQFYQDGEEVFGRFTPDENLVGYPPFIHGGIISTLLDEVIIWAVFAGTSTFGVTAELNVRFIKPMKAGETVTVRGYLLEKKGRMKRAQGEILNTRGEVLARGEGKVLIVRKERLQNQGDSGEPKTGQDQD
jgi:uncharacterized protein (TIGR00369 family)